MAGASNADVRLLFGVQGKGSLSGESGALIKSELTQIISRLNKNPLKVKVTADASSIANKSWSSQVQKKLNELSKNGSISVRVSKVDVKQSALSDFKKQINAVLNTISLDKGISITVDSKRLGQIKSEAKQASDEISNMARASAQFKAQMDVLDKQGKTTISSIERLSKTNLTGDEAARVSALRSQYEKYIASVEEIRALKKTLSAEERASLDASNNAIMEEIRLINKKKESEKQAAAAKKAADAESEKAAKRASAEIERSNTLLRRAENLHVQISKAIKEWGAASTGKSSQHYDNIVDTNKELDVLISKFRSGNISTDAFSKGLSNLNTRFTTSASEIKKVGENTKTLMQRMGGLASKFGAWLTVSQVVMQAVRAVKQMVTAVIEVDTAMTELRKVTDETNRAYTKFLDNSIVRAKELGTKVSDIVTATADFARLGYNIQDASSLADAAVVYKNVGDGIEDISSASESIISTMKAFNIEASESMYIVDKFNEIGNNFAISSSGIGDALMKSASSLSAAGNDLDESIALITAMNSTVQDADKVGTTLKTLTMYLRAAKTEAEAAGESTEGMAGSMSELREEILSLTGGKVDIQIDEDTFKSTYQIMKELSSVWGELTDISQANLLEMIGGKRNSDAVMSLINNFQTAEDVLESTANAAGSAMAENDKYMESINGHISVFRASFQEVSSTLIGSDFVKLIIDIGTALLNIIESVAKVIDSIGGLNTVLMTTGGILVGLKINSILKLVSELRPAIARIGSDMSGLFQIFVDGFSASKQSGSSSLSAIGAGFKSVAGLASTAQLAITGVVAVIGIAVMAFNAYKASVEESRQRMIDTGKEASSLSDDISSLTIKYIDLNESISTNASAKDDLLNTQAELINKLGIEKDRIKDLTDEYGNLSDAIKQASIDALQESRKDLIGAVHASEDELISAADSGFFGGNNLVRISGSGGDYGEQESAYKALKILEDAGFIGNGTYSVYSSENGEKRSAGFAISLGTEEDLKTTEGILKAYEQIGQMLDAISAPGVDTDNFVFDTLNSQYSKIKEAVNGYKDSVLASNKALAEEYMLQELMGKEIPDTQDEFDSYRRSVIEAATASGQYVGSMEDIENAVDDVLGSKSEFSDFYNTAIQDTSNSSGVYSASLSDLSDTLSELQSSYSALEAAQSDMSSGGGLSPETIAALAEEEENYIEYLYEENGVIKLNTEAWKENANAKMQSEMADIQKEIDSLKDRNEALRESLSLYRERQELGDTSKTLALDMQATTKEIEKNNEAIAKNQGLLAMYGSLYGSITGDLDAYSSALSNFDVISSTIESVSNSFTTLADLQSEVADGFTLSLDRALEFASVYPEILNSATVASDGQISLNEGVVNSFIEGKKAELDAQIDTKINELEADKAVLTAKMEYSKAQLNIAKKVGEGEGQISKEVAEYKLNAGNATVQALIAAGIDQATAYKLVAASMADNTTEFNRVAYEVCTDVQGNFNEAARAAAQSIYDNMHNSKLSLASVAEQAHQAAIAIAGVGSGTVQGSSSVNGGGAGGVYTGGGSLSITSGKFEGTDFTYEAKTVQLEDFISDLELDISNYANAISQIDGQIAALKALRNSSLNKFQSSSSGGSSGGGSSGRGSSGSSASEEIDNWFEREYALHQHLIAMDAENVEDYLDWLNDAYQRAYKEGLIDLDGFYQYQEEVYTGLHDLFKDYLNDVEHEISMRENFESETNKIVDMYDDLIDAIEKEIANARAQGLDDTDDYIQELQDKWWDYTNTLKEMREEAEDDAKSALETLVDYQLDIIKQDLENEKDALNEKLDALKEFYDKQKDMLQDQYDEEQYLKEQSEKRKSVTDIQSELAMLEYDDSAWAQKRKLELQEELSKAQEDLTSFEDEHALDQALDALDKAYNEQEAQIEAEMEALDEKLNDPDALYNQALAAIKDNTGNLYEAMLKYNRDYGTGNDEDVKDIYEEAYKALLEYKKLYGEDYKGIVIDNATGYKPDTGSWNSSAISGTNPSNKNPSTGNSGSNSSTSSSSNKPSRPSLSSGSTITVKKSATHFGSKSGGLKMASFVPGGNYTVYGTSGDQVLIGRNGVYTGWIRKTDIVGYATGTSHATPGIHAIDEIGSEYVFTSSDGTNYRVFNDGDKVLNAKATDFLYNFANNGISILEKIIKSVFGGSSIGSLIPNVVQNEIVMGDIIIHGNADRQTVSEIRRAQRDSLSDVLRGINKLNK